MRRLGFVSRYPKKFKVTTDSAHNNRIEPNRLDRKFLVNKVNTCWTTGITYIHTHQGFIYLCSGQLKPWPILVDHYKLFSCNIIITDL